MQHERYEVLREIGRGGMATVYLAQDRKFDKQVVLKVLPAHFNHDPQFKQRFQRAIDTISKVEHAAIVPVQDAGEIGGQPFYAMRWMSGGTLSDRIVQQGALKHEDVNRILTRIAGALDYMHQRGVVHRDVKPANILFDDAGQPYLSDFGIVKLTEESRTITSQIIGTPAYMSPEQVEGSKDVDHRTDVYSLGVVLFEMLTGSPPFSGSSSTQTMMKHVLEPVPNILDRNPGLAPQIADVVKQALAKNPDERHQTAAELATHFSTGQAGASNTEIKSGFQGEGQGQTIIDSPRRPVSPQKNRSPLLPIAGIMGALAIAIMGWFLIPIISGELANSTPTVTAIAQAGNSPTNSLPATATPQPSSTAVPVDVFATRTVLAVTQKHEDEAAAAALKAAANEENRTALSKTATAQTATVVAHETATAEHASTLTREAAIAEANRSATQTARAIAANNHEATLTSEAKAEEARVARIATETAERQKILDITATYEGTYEFSLSTSPAQTTEGDCFSIVWETDNVESVWLVDNNGQRSPLSVSGSLQKCDLSAGTHDFAMEIVLKNGETVSRTTTHTVEAMPTCRTNLVTLQIPIQEIWPERYRADSDFGGNGPEVVITVAIQGRQSTSNQFSVVGMNLHLYMSAIEFKQSESDKSYSEKSTNESIYQVPTGWRIYTFPNPSAHSMTYIDNDHAVDVFTYSSANLVSKYEVMGDGKGNDIGRHTHAKIFFNQITFELVEDSDDCSPP